MEFRDEFFGNGKSLLYGIGQCESSVNDVICEMHLRVTIESVVKRCMEGVENERDRIEGVMDLMHLLGDHLYITHILQCGNTVIITYRFPFHVVFCGK